MSGYTKDEICVVALFVVTIWTTAVSEETEWSITPPEDNTANFIVDVDPISYGIEFATAKWCPGDEECQMVSFHCNQGERCVVALYDADGNERGAVVYDERGTE